MVSASLMYLLVGLQDILSWAPYLFSQYKSASKHSTLNIHRHVYFYQIFTFHPFHTTKLPESASMYHFGLSLEEISSFKTSEQTLNN